jgi:hypothetical protein
MKRSYSSTVSQLFIVFLGIDCTNPQADQTLSSKLTMPRDGRTACSRWLPDDSNGACFSE